MLQNVSKQYYPTHYTTAEGDFWYAWTFGPIWLEDLEKHNGDMYKFFAVKFENGDIWDKAVGWAKPPVLKLNRWDTFFLSLAEFYAQRSKDPSTKCGAIIARGNRQISQGFNGFPMGVDDDPARYDYRELKLQMIIHAEINAILFAKVDLTGTTIYTWPFPPCCRCAAVIIQSGIQRIVAPTPSGVLKGRWIEELAIAKLMYEDADIHLVEVKE